MKTKRKILSVSSPPQAGKTIVALAETRALAAEYVITLVENGIHADIAPYSDDSGNATVAIVVSEKHVDEAALILQYVASSTDFLSRQQNSADNTERHRVYDPFFS